MIANQFIVQKCEGQLEKSCSVEVIRNDCTKTPKRKNKI